MQNSPPPPSLSDALPFANIDNQLCGYCATMFSTYGFEALWSPRGYKGWYSKRYIDAPKTCKLCRLIPDQDESTPLYFRASGGYTAHIKQKMHTLSSDGTNTRNPRSIPSGVHFPGRPVVDKNSEWAAAAAKAWLRECQENHPECRARGEHPRLPTRILDVGSMSDSQWIRLRIPVEDQRGEYLALSYCWGGEQPFTTTTQTLETMKDGFPASELPPTLRDAVQVTRNLGIRFLWIDALCIVQNSPEDKGREIARMGQIYKNATATIMAAAAESASEGFLSSNPYKITSCEVSLTVPDGTSGRVTICPIERLEFGWMPLSKRAWSFQEHFLSSRHLVYTDKELVWQCRSLKVATITKGPVRYAPPDRLEPFDSDDRNNTPHALVLLHVGVGGRRYRRVALASFADVYGLLQGFKSDIRCKPHPFQKQTERQRPVWLVDRSQPIPKGYQYMESGLQATIRNPDSYSSPQPNTAWTAKTTEPPQSASEYVAALRLWKIPLYARG
ncbi:heterokaryon incompatibility protein [Apiospora saccharicola]|uniref:Heterokaryon incompatibility protein n=1 Tax=Apiospora saccharicola TaxID=335842 RepID=A0ABR1UN60_9PEZI